MAVLVDDAILAGIVLILGYWVVTHPPQPIPLPDSPKSEPVPMATEAVVIGVIEGARTKILAEAAALATCCPPCVPPVGTVCIFVHLYATGTVPHAPCLPPLSVGHFHIKIKKQFVGKNTGECGCAWESIDPDDIPGLCIGAGINFYAVMAKYFTEGAPQCQGIRNANHIPIA